MVTSIVVRGPLYWLRSPKDNANVRLNEWILAIARLWISACSLYAFRADSNSTLKVFVLLFLLYSLLIILMLRRYSLLSPPVHVGIHCADIFWAVSLIIMGHMPVMLLVLTFFVMASAAFRWGFWEEVITDAVFCAMLLIGFSIIETGITQILQRASFSKHAGEGVLALVIVFLAGFLAEASATRSEANFLARSLEEIRLKEGLEQAVSIMCTHALNLYGPSQVLFVIQDNDSNQCWLYRLGRSQETLQSSMLDSSQREKYLFPVPPGCWCVAAHRPHHKNRFTCCMLKAGKITKKSGSCSLPDSFLTAHPFRLLLAASHVYESGWAVRFYMLNPIAYVAGTAGLRFMERSVHLLAPVIHDVFLMDQLETRATAAAGSRVARELHDGVIQSLSSIHMQLEEIRLQAASVGARAADRIGQIQKAIQAEITGLRDLTQQLRSLELDPGRLLSFLSGMAMKFQCEHGITTRFISEVEEIPLQPRVCVELARIVQEALANVRKHSGANEATVCLDRRDDHWVLRITDNGRGFDFIGRRSHEELQASGMGPIVLMERARTIDGSVAIQSREGDGACLEITFPQNPSESHG